MTRVGFFTDTSVCIGCKACEVACKEWNGIPATEPSFTGRSYDNTVDLDANSWRHVAFIEQRRPLGAHEGGDLVSAAQRLALAEEGLDTHEDAQGMRWLMSSDVCKHCTHAACLEVCPTGALFRTEFGTVVVQEDVCNGCGYCIPTCPFGVLDRREGDGRAWKCTLCYDRLKDDREPACAQACPTDSIQFGELGELRERAADRVKALNAAGQLDVRLYGADPDDGVGGFGAFFLLLDEPEVYGLPPDPVDPSRHRGRMWRAVGAAAAGLAAGVAISVLGGTTVSSAPNTREGLPIIKAPVWTPEAPFYLYAGGLAGASAALAWAAERTGSDELARRGWLVSAAGVGACPVLLVSDLGVPRRFLNMLRVFKVTSPMSMGSWLLTVTGAAISVSAVDAVTGRAPAPLAAAARPAAALLGLPLATYAGALLAHTAVPVWQEARAELPAVFAAGAAASAGAALTAVTPPRHAGPARRLAVLGSVAEIAATEVMQRRLGDTGAPYRDGAAGRMNTAAKALFAGGAAVIATAGGRSRAAAVAGGSLVTAGAVLARWSVYRAGFQSAADPRATVDLQRRRLAAR